MEESNTMNILKNAFLLEQQGKNLYQQAMENAQSEKVKNFLPVSMGKKMRLQ